MISTRCALINSSDRLLQGAVVDAADRQGATPAILFVHGLQSDQKSYVYRAERTVRALRCRCLRFDLSGHGAQKADFASYSISDHLEDVVAAYDYLAQQEGTDPVRIGACGASYGAYLVALLTRRRHLKRLVLRAPALFSDISISSPEDHESSSFDSLAAVAEFAGDILIVESECDDAIPRSNITSYLNACRHPSHEVIPRARHALDEPAWDEAFISFLTRWFEAL